MTNQRVLETLALYRRRTLLLYRRRTESLRKGGDPQVSEEERNASQFESVRQCCNLDLADSKPTILFY